VRIIGVLHGDCIQSNELERFEEIASCILDLRKNLNAQFSSSFSSVVNGDLVYISTLQKRRQGGKVRRLVCKLNNQQKKK